MAYHPTVLSQLIQSVPRLEFEKLAQAHDGARRSDALPRWSQFIALAVGHLGQRHSLRDIEADYRIRTPHPANVFASKASCFPWTVH